MENICEQSETCRLEEPIAYKSRWHTFIEWKTLFDSKAFQNHTCQFHDFMFENEPMTVSKSFTLCALKYIYLFIYFRKRGWKKSALLFKEKYKNICDDYEIYHEIKKIIIHHSSLIISIFLINK